MSTYGDLQDRIADDLNRTDLSDQIRDQIKLAIIHYGTFPFWFNEGRTTLTGSSSTSFLTVPSDYLDVVELYINVGNYPVKMEQKPLDFIVGYRGTNESQPGAYCYFGDRFELDCKVNQQYTFPLWYIKELATLSATTDSSLWTYQAEDLVVFRAEKMLYSRVLKDKAEAASCAALEREARTSRLRFRDQKIGTGSAKPWGY
jgi:hypothetical protein